MHNKLRDELLGRRNWLNRNGLSSLRTMLTIRAAEQELEDFVRSGELPGSTHQAIGMEAVAAGVCSTLEQTDFIVSHHRNHGHCIAKGIKLDAFFAELLGRQLGVCGGKGGSMVLASIDVGILCTDAIVGAGIGISTGAALAASLSNNEQVIVSFFGDGAVNQGLFHECLNLAALWDLPCLFVCENNQYAKSCSVQDMVSIGSIALRADAYGIPGVEVDGMDIVAVADATKKAVSRARTGAGPTLIVADTYRYCGHSVGDTEIYRTETEKEAWLGRDPIPRLERELLENVNIDAEGLAKLRDEVGREVRRAADIARCAPSPPTDVAFTGVYGD